MQVTVALDKRFPCGCERWRVITSDVDRYNMDKPYDTMLRPCLGHLAATEDPQKGLSYSFTD